MFQLTFDILNDDDMVMADDGDVDAERCRIGFSAEWTEPTPLSADAAIDVLAKHAPSSARSQLSVRAVHGSRDLDNLPATASTLKELINLDKLQMMRDKTRPVARWFGTTGTNVGASANVRAFVEEIIQNGGGIGSGMATTKSDAADAWNSLPQRQDHDFTELFWTFAQGILLWKDGRIILVLRSNTHARTNRCPRPGRPHRGTHSRRGRAGNWTSAAAGTPHQPNPACRSYPRLLAAGQNQNVDRTGGVARVHCTSF